MDQRGRQEIDTFIQRKGRKSKRLNEYEETVNRKYMRERERELSEREREREN